MGIRFYCPNGHKLNVKEFQAGRRGICPFCGARTQIPTQSTRPSSKSAGVPGGAPSAQGPGRHGAAQAATQTLHQDDAEATQASDSSPDILPGEPPSLPGDPGYQLAGHDVPMVGGKMLGPSTPLGTPSGGGPVIAPPTLPAGGGHHVPMVGPAPTISPLPPGEGQGVRATSISATPTEAVNLRPAPAQKPSPTPSPGQPGPAAATTPAPTTLAAPTTPAAPTQPATPEPADPISEAPDMIWYVRPPSGGQFGPAAGELMRTWLSEGRVSADSLVWREGWRDWQEAGKVFPKLRSNQIIDFLETTPVVSVAADHGYIAPAAAHTHRPKPRQASDRNQIALLVVLSLLVIILFVVFLLVAFHS